MHRQHDLDLSALAYGVTAGRQLAEPALIGRDMLDRPLWVALGRVYDQCGRVVSVSGRSRDVHAHDIIRDLAQTTDADIPAEVALAAALSVAEDYVFEAITDLEVGEPLTPWRLHLAIEEALRIHPRFRPWRQVMIRANSNWIDT